MAGSICLHCGEGIDYSPGSRAGKRGFFHTTEPVQRGHPAVPADHRSGPDHRLQQKIDVAHRRDLDSLGGPVAAFVLANIWQMPFQDRRAE